MSFGSFLVAALEVIARDLETAHHTLVGMFGSQSVELQVNMEILNVSAAEGQLIVSNRASENATISVHTNKRELLDLVDANSSWLESIIADRMRVYGRPIQVTWFFEVLKVFLKAAVRCRDLVHLLQRYRSEG